MIRTTCAYCGVGCGIAATVTGERQVQIAGDPEHPANRGRLCSKGTHLGETLGLEGRLLHPEIDGRRASWDKAIRHVARKFADTIRRHGPDSVAFYVSGQLLTEDYYAVNKLAKGFLGTNNVDSNSRLCMSSAVAGYTGAFGSDGPPPAYADIDEAEVLLVVGSNTSACHPIVWNTAISSPPSTGSVAAMPGSICVIGPISSHLACMGACIRRTPERGGRWRGAGAGRRDRPRRDWPRDRPA